MLLLGLIVAAFILFAGCFVVGWFVALGMAVYSAVRGESVGRDHRAIEQDSAGIDF